MEIDCIAPWHSKEQRSAAWYRVAWHGVAGHSMIWYVRAALS